MEDKPRLKIEDYLSVRTSNALYACREELKYLDELDQLSADEFMRFRHVGKRCLTELRMVLAEHGLALKDEKIWSPWTQRDLLMSLEKDFEKLTKKVARTKLQIQSLEKDLDRIAEKLERPR